MVDEPIGIFAKGGQMESNTQVTNWKIPLDL